MRLSWTAGLLLSVCTGCAQNYFASTGTDGETDTDTETSTSGPTPSTSGMPEDDDSSSGEESTSTSGAASTTELPTTGAVCGQDIDVFEDDSMAICKPEASTTERLVECVCAYDPALLQPAERPLDATDLLYYVNRWHSIDPCFPFTPASSLLADVRQQYINAVDNLEPEMLRQCGDYEVEFVQLPPAFTNDDDQLLAYAWTSPAPEDYPTTLQGEEVGLEGQVGFAPMFAAAAEVGIGLFVQSGFRSMQTQADLFEYYAGVEGDPSLAAVYSAWPAHSEHQLGTTADVGYVLDGQMVSPFDPLEADLHASEAFQWIHANAHRFGIVTTYQPRRVHVHQYKPEPWHLRFVGPEAADLVHTCGLSTEEVLAFRYGKPAQPEFMHMDLVYDAVLEGGWDEMSCD